MCKRKLCGYTVCIFFICLGMAGCGKKAVEYNDNSDTGSAEPGVSFDDTDSADLGTSLGVPPSYGGELQTGDSDLSSIEIDAEDIQTPEQATASVLHMKEKKLDNAYRQAVIETVFDKEDGIYQYSDILTKEDLQAEIDSYERAKMLYQEEGDMDLVANAEERIAECKQNMETAPEDYPAVTDYSVEGYVGTMDGQAYTCTVSVDDYPYVDLQIRENPEDETAYDGVSYITWDSLTDGITEDTQGAKENQCKSSKDQLQNKAEDFMAKMGATDYVLESADTLYKQYMGYEEDVVAAIANGYEFTYKRAVNNAPVLETNVESSDNMSAYGYFYIPTERFTIAVNDDGILRAEWCDYLEVTEETKNVRLLSFQEFLEKANETVAEYFTTYPTGYTDLTFTDMKLGYVLMEDQETGGYKYAPAWTLTQQSTTYNPLTLEEETSDVNTIILDAADGTYVDCVKLAKTMNK